MSRAHRPVIASSGKAQRGRVRLRLCETHHYGAGSAMVWPTRYRPPNPVRFAEPQRTLRDAH